MYLDDLEVYNIPIRMSNIAWEIYRDLLQEHKFTLGSQLLRACDSIGANLAEGYGRYHFKDSLKFYYYYRGSLFELKYWILLIDRRHLANQEKRRELTLLIENEQLKLNAFINSMKSRINQE
jgi:four helix bundle protein